MGGLPLPGLLGLGPHSVAHPRAHLWLQGGEGCPMLGAHPLSLFLAASPL